MDTPVAEAREYLTPQEIASTYRVSDGTVQRWIQLGITAYDEKGEIIRVKLEAYPVRRRWRVTPAALAEFVKKAQIIGPTADAAKSA